MTKSGKCLGMAGAGLLLAITVSSNVTRVPEVATVVATIIACACLPPFLFYIGIWVAGVVSRCAYGDYGGGTWRTKCFESSIPRLVTLLLLLTLLTGVRAIPDRLLMKTVLLLFPAGWLMLGFGFILLLEALSHRKTRKT